MLGDVPVLAAERLGEAELHVITHIWGPGSAYLLGHTTYPPA